MKNYNQINIWSGVSFQGARLHSWILIFVLSVVFAVLLIRTLHIKFRYVIYECAVERNYTMNYTQIKYCKDDIFFVGQLGFWTT